MQPHEYQRRIRTREAAIYVGLSKSTLEKLRLTGNGPRYAKLGKIITYSIDDLNAWVAERVRTSTSDSARAA
jgi:predicted DNA-binding transcriptional regulator AlpA